VSVQIKFMNKANEEKLKEILVEVFDIEDSVGIQRLEDLEKIEENLHWDSLAIISLIAACESEFKFAMDIEDYEKISSISTIKSVLSKNNF